MRSVTEGTTAGEANADNHDDDVSFAPATLVCPISGTENPGNRSHCVQCGTDLRPLIRVSRLPFEYLTRGLALSKEGRGSEALEHLAVAVSLQPQSAQAHLALAGAYLDRGLHDLAWRHYEDANMLEPTDRSTGEFREVLERKRGESDARVLEESRRANGLRRLTWGLPVIAFALGLLVMGALPRLHIPPVPLPGAILLEHRFASLAATRDLKLNISEREGELSVSGVVPDEMRLHLVRDIAIQETGGKADLSELTTEPPEPPHTYRVQPGDSMWLIAKRKYGNGTLWPGIAKANTTSSVTPKMNVGDTLILPTLTLGPH